MIKKFNKKILASLLVLATVVSTLFGAAIPVSAAPPYLVTFNDICNNVNVYVPGSVPPVDSANTDANGDLSFTITRSAGYTLIDVYLEDASVASLTKTGESGNDTYYDIEDATGPVTVKILACTAYTGQTGLDGYTLNTPAQLNTLASTVNSGTPYAGSYFLLTDNISLAAYSPWTPIGGHCTVSGYVPTGAYFAGVFDGDGHTISNISITASTAGYGGYGLFGYVNGGTIGNLTLSGSISLSNNVSFVGGVVGYLYGNVYSCHNQMSITCTAGSSNIGGIAGCAERILTDSIPAANYIKCCSNSGSISGGGREGGIAGATYCHSSPQVDTGGIIVDCCFNTGNITCTETSKTYMGGIVGYNSGYISNCYNSGTLTGNGSSYSIYIGGIAGILTNGYGYACSKADNVYNSGNFANFKSGYAHYLFGRIDNSGVQITNAFWLARAGVTKNSYGSWVINTYGEVTENRLKGIDPLTSPLSGYILDYLGSAFGLPIPPVYGYPFLQCQGSLTKPLIGGTPGPVRTDSDSSGAIFLDGVDGDDTYNGSTKTYTGGLNGPVKTFNRAKTLLSSAAVKTIYIVNTVTVNSSESWTFTGSGIADPIVKRSCSCEGYLINVTTGGTLTLQGIVIDGNKANFVATTGSLIAVDAGSLSINSAVTLQNNAANGGGALRITGGAVTLGGGTISNCSAINYGGAAMILGNGAFTMNSGTITSNSATKGGGVALIENGAFTLTGGTINASNNDTGVYVGDSTATFTLNPASAIIFGANNIIYLETGTKIWIASTLDSYVSSLTLEAEDEASYPVVAEGDSYTIDEDDDLPVFAYVDAGWYFHLDGSNRVYINQTA